MKRDHQQSSADSEGGTSNLSGGCACGLVRYTFTAKPLIVHACHCRDCQRITGSAFVINIWIEKKFVERGAANLHSFELSGGSGQPHRVFFCSDCGTYVWSEYDGAGRNFLFVRAGTLDHPDAVIPNVHIFTRSKVPWLELPQGALAFKSFYKLDQVWPAESLQRLRAARADHS